MSTKHICTICIRSTETSICVVNAGEGDSKDFALANALCIDQHRLWAIADAMVMTNNVTFHEAFTQLWEALCMGLDSDIALAAVRDIPNLVVEVFYNISE